MTTRSIPACAGNPGLAAAGIGLVGSIPACAGEPENAYS